jgi:NADH pyrophosphatase NudC (nudix superfamily)
MSAMTADYRFCPCCAAPLALTRGAGGRWAQAAAALHGLRLHALEQPDAGAGGHRAVGDRVLLARNAAWQHRMFALITGFMEAGETPEEGIRREIAEETGLEVTALRLVGVHDFQRMNQVIITYHAWRKARSGCRPSWPNTSCSSRRRSAAGRRHRAGAGRLAAGAGHRTPVHGSPASVT